MALVDAQGTQLEFDGIVVGGVIQYDVKDGVTPSVNTTMVDVSTAISLPGVPDFGEIAVLFRRDLTDAGQQALHDNYNAPAPKVGRIIRQDGSGVQFKCWVRAAPLSGAISGTEESRVRLKIVAGYTEF